MTYLSSEPIIGAYKQRHEIVKSIMTSLDQYLDDYDNLKDDLEIEFTLTLVIKD